MVLSLIPFNIINFQMNLNPGFGKGCSVNCVTQTSEQFSILYSFRDIKKSSGHGKLLHLKVGNKKMAPIILIVSLGSSYFEIQELNTVIVHAKRKVSLNFALEVILKNCTVEEH